jgi:hypothetical protein
MGQGEGILKALVKMVANPSRDALAGLLGVVGLGLLSWLAKRIFGRVFRPSNGAPKAPRARPDAGIVRLALDRLAPRLHSWFTSLGFVPEPPYLAVLRAHLKQLADEGPYYLPLDARQVPEYAKLAPPDDRDRVSGLQIARIRQSVRLVLGTREGGDLVTPQLATANRRSRLVRNIVSILARAKEPLVLLGDPGTGKTMTLHEVARACARRERYRVFPSCVVVVRLSRIRAKLEVDDNVIHELIRKELKEQRPSLEQYYDMFIKLGRLTVLFDGMDEMPRRNYDDYVSILSQFGMTYIGRVKTLYSCRINDFSPTFRHRQLVLMPFNNRQIRELLDASFPNGLELEKRRITVDEAWRTILAEEFPLEVSNPLILTQLIHYLDEKKAWPTSRSVLFDQYLRRNYDKFESVQKTRSQQTRPLGYEAAVDQWSLIALTISQRNSGESLDLQMLDKELDRSPIEAAVEEGVICGIMLRDEHEPTIIRFGHHRVQEYLAAVQLANHPRQMDWLEVLDDPRWQETALNLATITGRAQAVDALEKSLPSRGFVIAGGGMTNPAVSNRVAGVIWERLAADRTVLAARVVRETGRNPGSAGAGLFLPTVSAVRQLLSIGNPITQVKMLAACQLLRDIDFYTIADPALTSPIGWVRNQALMIAAIFDATQRIVSESFSLQLVTDLASNRFLRRFPAYLKAAARASNRALTAHVIVASFSVLVRILAAAGCVIVVDLIKNRLNQIYSFLPDFYGSTPLEWGAVPAMAAASWYFVVRSDKDLETTLLTSGVLYIAILGALRGIMEGRFESVLISVGMLEAAFFILPPLVPACKWIGAWVYRFGLLVIGGDARPAKSLFKYAIEESLVSQAVIDITSALLRVGRRVWLDLAFAVGISALAASSFLLVSFSDSVVDEDWGAASESPNWRWQTLLVIAASGLLVFWIVWRFRLITESLSHFRRVKSFSQAVSSRIIQTVSSPIYWRASKSRRLILVGAGLAVLIGTIAFLQLTYPAQAQRLGFWVGLVLIPIALVMLVYKVFEPNARRAYLSVMAQVDTAEKWANEIKFAKPALQAQLMTGVDYERFRVSAEAFLKVTIEIESSIKDDPAASAYWALRQRLELIERQQYGGRFAAEIDRRAAATLR